MGLARIGGAAGLTRRPGMRIRCGVAAKDGEIALPAAARREKLLSSAAYRATWTRNRSDSKR